MMWGVEGYMWWYYKGGELNRLLGGVGCWLGDNEGKCLCMDDEGWGERKGYLLSRWRV